MKLVFGAKALQSRSKRASAGACSNFIREIEGESFSLVGRPGLLEKADVGTGPIRGMIEADSRLFAVSNKDLYEIDDTWTATDRGNLETTSGRVSMSYDGTYICIVDGTYVYTLNITDDTFARNTDADILPNPTHTAFSDGFHFINDSLTGQIATHETAYDPSGNWDALDFATAEYAPDELISIVPDHGNLFLLGKRTTEVWEYDLNSSALPLTPIRSAYMEFGTAAAHSPIKYDNSVVWLARDTNGQGVAIRAVGVQPTIVSTPELHAEWASYSTIADAFSQVWWIEGHPLWILIFPTADKSWVYDASSGGWSEFNRYDADIENRGRHISNASAFFNNKVVCGNYQNGKIYNVDFDYYDDNGTTILCSAESQKVWDGGRRLFHSRIELMFERGVGLRDDQDYSAGTPDVYTQGSEPKVRLEYSDDDGNTWYDRGWKDIGSRGEYRKRVYWLGMGSSYERIYRISMSDPVEWILAGSELDVA